MRKNIVFEQFRNRCAEDLAAIESLDASKVMHNESLQTARQMQALVVAAKAKNVHIDSVAPLLSQRILNNIFFSGTNTPSGSEGAEPVMDSEEMLKSGQLVIARMPGLVRPKGFHTATFTTNDTKGSCSMAEGYFRDALTQIRTGRRRGHKIISAYHNEGGEPIALRKNTDESSAITLRRLKLGPLILPPGTIVGVGNKSAEITGSLKRGSYVLNTFLAGRQFQVTPRRLSPWAFNNPADRALFGLYDNISSPTYNETRGRIASEIEIDDFREAAHKVMELCGVAA